LNKISISSIKTMSMVYY